MYRVAHFRTNGCGHSFFEPPTISTILGAGRVHFERTSPRYLCEARAMACHVNDVKNHLVHNDRVHVGLKRDW